MIRFFFRVRLLRHDAPLCLYATFDAAAMPDATAPHAAQPFLPLRQDVAIFRHYLLRTTAIYLRR